MKYLIVFLLSFIIVSTLHAQSFAYKDSLLTSLRNSKILLNKTLYLNPQDNSPINSTGAYSNQQNTDPSVLKLPQPKLVYIGNNNHHNIYQSSPDNIYLIKPDSTIKLNMPVADNK